MSRGQQQLAASGERHVVAQKLRQLVFGAHNVQHQQHRPTMVQEFCGFPLELRAIALVGGLGVCPGTACAGKPLDELTLPASHSLASQCFPAGDTVLLAGAGVQQDVRSAAPE